MSIFRLPSAPLFPEWATSSSSKDAKLAQPCMPAEWTSDDSMLGFFGPLDANNKNSMVQRQRDARLAFWRALILSAYRTHPTLSLVDPILSESVLKVLLRRNDLVPMGIDAILNDLVKHNILVPVNQILNPQPTGWWSKLLSFVSAPPQEEVQYVLTPIATERAARVLDSFPKDRRLFTEEEFWARCVGVNLELLRHYMPQISFFEVRGVKGVKIGKDISDRDPTPGELTLFHMTNSIRSLESREEKFSKEVKNLRREVVVKLKEGNRAAAALLLKRAKLYESHLTKAMHSKDTLLRIVASIEEAQTNVEVLQAMQMGAATLEAENQKIGSAGTVEDLLDDVSELIQETSDLSDVIMGTPSSPSLTPALNAIDEAELEKELEELVLEKSVTTISTASTSNATTAPLKASPTTTTTNTSTSQASTSAQASSSAPQTTTASTQHMDELVAELEALSVPSNAATTSEKVSATSLGSPIANSAAPVAQRHRDPQGEAELV